MTLRRFWILALLSLALVLATTPTPAAQAGAAVLNPKLSGDQQTNPIALVSPDGNRVVYTVNVGGAAKLYSAPTDGSAAPVQLDGLLSPLNNATQFAISPDSSRVVFLFQDSLTNQQELYSAPIGGGPHSRLSPNLQDFATVTNFLIGPDGGQVVFRADLAADDEFRLYSVGLLGGVVHGQSKQPVVGGDVAPDFAFSPDGSRVIYRGDLDTDGVIELYRSDLGSFGSTRLSDPLAMGENVHSFKVAPGGADVVYLANQETLVRNELFRAPMQPAGAPAIKLNRPIIGDGDVTTYQITPDSASVIYRADPGLSDQHQLYQVALAGGESRRLNGDFAGAGVVAPIFGISPNSRWAVYLSDERATGTFELYAASLESSSRIRLNKDLAAGGDVSLFAISPDSQRVVYRADQDTAGTLELYSSRIVEVGSPGAASQGAAAPQATSSRVKLNGPMAGDVAAFLISPAADRVIYLADQATAGVNELFYVPIAGGATPVRLHRTLDGARDVSGGVFTKDGGRVIYRANQDDAATFSIYAAYDPAPLVTLAGPAGPLEPGEYELTVRLSDPPVLSGVKVRLARSGDAVAGEGTGDYLLSGSMPSVASDEPALAGDPDELVVSLAPGQAENTLRLYVFSNPERVAPRTLQLSVVPSAEAGLGEQSVLNVILAGNQAQVDQLWLYLPLLRR